MHTRKKGISGKGNGKWHSLAGLARYRVARDKAKKNAKASRKRNRL